MAVKQATKGQKQIDKENAESLRFYRHIVLLALAMYALIRFLVLGNSVYWAHYLMLISFSLAHLGSYQFMSSMASKGIDLNVQSGMAEHAKDVILLTVIIQALTLVSGYFLLLWLLIPGYAFYLLWVNFLGPWFFAAPPEVDEKQMKKMDRKAKRQFAYK
ncbi:transmembrane protein 208-like [Rhopilema esculentum]|uniref:transmembrane protein 208-like n=1 Tax=Rhopilema esculentum TaxID=499914 RepID=UPI0031D960DB